MNRRNFNQTIAPLLATANLLPQLTAANQKPAVNEDHVHQSIPKGPPQQIAMLAYPQMTALDLMGPQAFLAGLGNVQVHLVWKKKELVTTDNGLQIQASKSLQECPRDLEILFVPGGSKGTIALMNDLEVIDFLADRGSRAKYVTSVCTGSILLASAGLLRGCRATSHWAVREILPSFGAELGSGRVIEDQNRITAGGVTAGIDFGFLLAARLRDPNYAQMLQLAFEYDPHPPFQAGTPDTAPVPISKHMRERFAPMLTAYKDAAVQAQARLGIA